MQLRSQTRPLCMNCMQVLQPLPSMYIYTLRIPHACIIQYVWRKCDIAQYTAWVPQHWPSPRNGWHTRSRMCTLQVCINYIIYVRTYVHSLSTCDFAVHCAACTCVLINHVQMPCTPTLCGISSQCHAGEK